MRVAPRFMNRRQPATRKPGPSSSWSGSTGARPSNADKPGVVAPDDAAEWEIGLRLEQLKLSYMVVHAPCN